jgi:hypothetical protein
VFNGSLTNRVIINKEVTVQSMNGPAVTLIQGNSILGSNAVRCVLMATDSVLSGFTLTNGGTSSSGNVFFDNSGGGIWATNSVNALITNCMIIKNVAFAFGGGIYSRGAINSKNVINSSIIQNTAASGAGLAFCGATNCLILSNSAAADGGEAFSSDLINCKLLSNVAGQFGGGTASTTSSYGCLVVSNKAVMRGGAMDSAMYVLNCTIVGNTSVQGRGAVSSAIESENNII